MLSRFALRCFSRNGAAMNASCCLRGASQNGSNPLSYLAENAHGQTRAYERGPIDCDSDAACHRLRLLGIGPVFRSSPLTVWRDAVSIAAPAIRRSTGLAERRLALEIRGNGIVNRVNVRLGFGTLLYRPEEVTRTSLIRFFGATAAGLCLSPASAPLA